ncbi:hypothetical protein J6590_079392 [Homalodisca vitripennis]|nr:hypothetical protein J6590_079392 [Homalodisca vitripennis]
MKNLKPEEEHKTRLNFIEKQELKLMQGKWLRMKNLKPEEEHKTRLNFIEKQELKLMQGKWLRVLISILYPLYTIICNNLYPIQELSVRNNSRQLK